MATTSTLNVKESRNSAAGEISTVLDKNDSGGGGGGGGGQVDLEMGRLSLERDCRICHMSLESPDLDDAIVLGCSCKEDLANAHKHCAEAWFKIKGNKTCEICGAIAQNVTGPNEPELLEQWSESNDATPPPRPPAPTPPETPNFWRGHRFLNFLLACMVFAFVISWLFHFNIHLRQT